MSVDTLEPEDKSQKPSQLPTASKQVLQTVPLEYDGTLAELVPLWLKTTLLTVVTLGFYRFWATTRMRRYLWSRVILDGDRFEYDGTGKELLIRFLVAFAIFLPLFALPSIGMFILGDVFMADFLSYAVVLAFFGLASYAYYTGRRYRLNRTLWRGIRADLHGSSLQYLKKALIAQLWTILTFGIYAPWKMVRLWTYEMQHMTAGDVPFRFRAEVDELIKPFFLGAMITLVTITSLVIVPLLAILPLFLPLLPGFSYTGLPTDMEPSLALMDMSILFLSVPFVVCILGLQSAAFSWYEATWLNVRAKGTALQGVRFKGKATVSGMWWLRFGNLLIYVLTLGFGAVFAQHRTLRFLCNNIGVYGWKQLQVLKQSDGTPKKRSEGLAELLGETGGF